MPARTEAAHLGYKAVAFSTVPISFQWAQDSLDRAPEKEIPVTVSSDDERGHRIPLCPFPLGFEAGEETLRELAAEGKETEVRCEFCGKEYLFSPEELTALAEEQQLAEGQ